MTTCLGKSCSFGLPRVPDCCQFMYLVVFFLFFIFYFFFGVGGRIWDLIVSVPDRCLFFNFNHRT